MTQGMVWRVDHGQRRAYVGYVALCYRIAGHVKQAAKEVKGIAPAPFACPGLFLGREAA
jgi:hypothetical protein